MAVQPPVEEDHLPLGDTRRRASLVAGRLSASYGIVVYMYIRDHGVPHVHARYGDDVASVELATGVLLAGSLQPRQAALVREWVDLHRGELPQAWELAASGEPPGALGPLLEPLRDPDYFARVSVGPEAGTVVWPKGLDLAPEVLHGDEEPAVALGFHDARNGGRKRVTSGRWRAGPGAR